MKSLFAIVAGLVLFAEARAARPNVLIIMPDDVSFNDFSFYNDRGPRTPHIDSLARESVRLGDFHVSPTCSPTRAALLTGRYNNATGAWHTILGRYMLRRDESTLADLARANGYRTGLFGKWHLGDSYPFRPEDRGFDYTVMHHGGGTGQQHDYWGNSNLPPSTYFVAGQPLSLEDDDDGIAGAYATNFFVTHAIRWMAERKTRDEPFFCYLAFNAAHDPQDRPPDARDGIGDRAATIENIDANIGRVERFLAENNLADNTLLIFLTDNGGPNPFSGSKSSHLEGGHRVPCFVRWKAGGIGGTRAGGREVSELTAHIDLLPTIADLFGWRETKTRPAELALHGRSLREHLVSTSDGPQPSTRGRTLVVDNQRLDDLVKYKQACVMQDEVDANNRIIKKWRLLRASSRAPWSLYDIATDPRQAQNLNAEGASAEVVSVVQRLSDAYEHWWTEISARADEPTRFILGAPQQPQVCLYAHDWHIGNPSLDDSPAEIRRRSGDGVPWNQRMIAAGLRSNGYHTVEFAKSGTYRFGLRRWPKEIADETSLTSALKQPVRGERGRSLPIHTARLRIWHGDTTYADVRTKVDGHADEATVDIPNLPAGPANLQSWFYDADGTEIAGAYYTYVQRK